MKTFLWTSLFRIVAVIAGLLCLGFGNLGTQVLDNSRMVKFLPHNVQTQTCDPVVASTLEGVDWCMAAESRGCYQIQENSDSDNDLDMQEILDSLGVIATNQETIYNQMSDSFASILQNISNLRDMYYQEPVDGKEQQRLDLLSQIEALQNQLTNL